MSNPLTTPITRDIKKGEFYSEAKKDVQSSKVASEFSNNELRIFQLEGRIKDLEKQMEQTIENMRPLWTVYNHIRDEKKETEARLKKLTLDSIIPKRDEE